MSPGCAKEEVLRVEGKRLGVRSILEEFKRLRRDDSWSYCKRLQGAVVSGAVREFAPFSGGMLAIVGTRTN